MESVVRTDEFHKLCLRVLELEKLAGLSKPESPIYEHIGWACYTTGNDGSDKMVLCGEQTFGAFKIYRTVLILILALVCGMASEAQCSKPTISNLVAASDTTGQQLTVTWTTSNSSDTMLVYGYLNAGTATAITDSGGVTSHSVTVAGLIPGATYAWGIRSQAINAGVGCGTGYYAYSLYKSIVTASPPAGTITYGITPMGPSYITQGYGIYIAIRNYLLTGTYTARTLTENVTISAGLAGHVSLRWSDAQLWGSGADTVSTTSITNDTLKVHDWSAAQASGFRELYISVDATAPVGDYTVTITGSATTGCSTNCPGTVTTTWPIHVVSSTAPFSGTPFTYGTPSSYPAIPNLSTYLASADTYGQQTCAQDQDTTNRVIRPNDTSNLTPVATCCTYASWFYDGVQVYRNVGNLLNNGRNWGQCRLNVYNVYSPYVLGSSYGSATVFMGFSKGYYTDYRINQEFGASNDIAILNKLSATASINGPYNGVYVDISYLQREVAYVLRNETHAVLLGINNPVGNLIHQSSSFVRDYALEHVLGMIDQACLSQNAQYFENFMFGLEAEELVEYYKLVSRDPRIPPALACLANWMYSTQWQHNQTGSFPYDTVQRAMGLTQSDTGSCMTTLNQLVSPMYAFLFVLSGSSIYQTEGDDVFSHGALFDGCTPSGPGAYLGFPGDSDGKSFSQQYLWGVDYVNWRSGVGVF